MAYLDPVSNNYVTFPLIRLPNGTLENPWSSAIYLTDALAVGAVGEFTALPFTNTAAFREVLARNNNDVLKVFSLGGRVAASVPVAAVPPNTFIPITEQPFLGGALDGEVFGIPVKLLLIGGVAWYFLKGK